MIPNEETHNLQTQRPHLVLLGAGASRAAFPMGDRNCKNLPLMQDLAQIVGLEPELVKLGFDYEDRSFEDVYSELFEGGWHRSVLHLIEEEIWEYFSILELPNNPTLYDHLVLSLREKDVIATFNWDPLLYKAWRRNYGKAKLPHLLFLHGNVAIGVCLNDHTKGMIGERCRKCGQHLKPSRLLFPIKTKNYASDPYISREWETLRRVLANAYIFTVFGYGAPKSDVEAISLMKEGWGRTRERNLEQVEIIDIKSKEELYDTWRDFIYSNNYWTSTSFYESWIARHPRRSCDALWRWIMDVQPVSDNTIPVSLGFEELGKWYKPIIEAEAPTR